MSSSCGWNISLVPPFCSSFHPWNITLTAVQTFVGITKLILISERMNDKISIKSEQNYFNFRKKNYPASLFSFCQCQHGDHLGVPVLKATHGESAGRQWQQMLLLKFFFSLEPNGWWGWRSMYNCTVKRRRRQIRSQKWPSWPIFQQHSSNIYFATNIKTLLNDHE